MDTFDQITSAHSCNRKTRRWPLTIFYGMINTAVSNAYILYKETMMQQGQKSITRRSFWKTLAKELIRPWAEHRMQRIGQQRNIQQTIKDVYPDINFPTIQLVPDSSTKKRCSFCKSKADRKTRFNCFSCKKPICLEHARFLCADCE